ITKSITVLDSCSISHLSMLFLFLFCCSLSLSPFTHIQTHTHTHTHTHTCKMFTWAFHPDIPGISVYVCVFMCVCVCACACACACACVFVCVFVDIHWGRSLPCLVKYMALSLFPVRVGVISEAVSIFTGVCNL